MGTALRYTKTNIQPVLHREGLGPEHLQEKFLLFKSGLKITFLLVYYIQHRLKVPPVLRVICALCPHCGFCTNSGTQCCYYLKCVWPRLFNIYYHYLWTLNENICLRPWVGRMKTYFHPKIIGWLGLEGISKITQFPPPCHGQWQLPLNSWLVAAFLSAF